MEKLMDFLNLGVSSYHVVDKCKERLIQCGFSEISFEDDVKDLKGKYFVSPFNSMLFAFTVGDKVESIKIAGGHTDFPSLKIKPAPDIKNKKYLQVNVEPYGGIIKEAWFDRPLGIAGKVMLKGDSVFKPRTVLFDTKRAVCTIAGIAPHLKSANDSKDIDEQKKLLPIIGLLDNEKMDFESLIRLGLNDSKAEILDYDLYLYIAENAEEIGYKGELLSSPRIDNISSVSALIEAIAKTEVTNQLNIVALFDNEEVGNRSKQGADSILLKSVIDKIMDIKGYSPNYMLEMNKNIFSLSVDVAHALHPNYEEKSDITNDVFIGGGVALKTSASQRYASDSEATAIILALCEKYGIKTQRQVNRSGMRGGSTIGPMLSTYMPVLSIDIGMPILAMHSARELGSTEDYRQLCKLVEVFFCES